MEQTRLILIIALTFLGLLLWEAWQSDYGAVPLSASTSTQPAPSNTLRADQPPVIATTGPVASQSSRASEQDAPTITVRSNALELRISLLGGVIEQARLLKYPTQESTSHAPF